jgi:hypothetical protein
MGRPMIERDFFNGGYVIRPTGKKDRRWAPAGVPDGHYSVFPTRAAAERFIRRGGLIEVTEIRLNDALAAAGWDQEAGYSKENIARFKAWCEAEGVYFYARPREKFFPSTAILEAQERGLSKVVMEDLS